MDNEIISTIDELLTSWGLPILIPIFKENQITIENCLDLTDSMIKELIPIIGTRMQFLKYFEELKKKSTSDGTDTSTITISTNEVQSDFSNEVDSEVDSNQGNDIRDPSTNNVSLEADDSSGLIIVPSVNRTISFCGLENLYTQDFVKKFPEFDLETLLTLSPHGSQILKYYRQMERLNDFLRNKLVDIIITHLYPYILQHRLTHVQYNIICAKILTLFPNELVTIYYKSEQRGGYVLQAKGKLVYKAHNILNNSPDKIYARKRKADKNEGINKRNRIDSEDEKNALLWLTYNREPWEDVLRYWNITFEMRRTGNFNTVVEFAKTWPIIGDPRADSLIEADFGRLYPEKIFYLLNRWDSFFNKVLEVKRTELNSRDTIREDILSILETSENLSEDSKVALQIAVLPRIAPPRGRTRVGKTHWKFNTNEAVEGILVHARGPGDIDRQIDIQIEKANKRKICRNVQPYLLVEGPELTQIRNVYIVIDKIRFHISGVLKGLDTLFKCFFALHIEYPVQSQHIWHLIQEVIYEIPVTGSKITGQAIDLMQIKFD